MSVELLPRPTQAKGRTSDAITKLCQLAPPTALLLALNDNGEVLGEREVPTELVHRGDLLKVGQMLLRCFAASENRVGWWSHLVPLWSCLPACPPAHPLICPCALEWLCQPSGAWTDFAGAAPCWPGVKVLPGARIPTDGEVVEGTSYVDESMLTGESGAVPAAVLRTQQGLAAILVAPPPALTCLAGPAWQLPPCGTNAPVRVPCLSLSVPLWCSAGAKAGRRRGVRRDSQHGRRAADPCLQASQQGLVMRD